jgi:murein DD-endopeptidase MepM/ murein hydrolase activator NlpD
MNLILQSPLRPQFNGIIMLNQGFGTNNNDFYRQLGLKGHNGLDMYTQNYTDGNAPVTAAHDGYVISDATKDSDTGGRRVWIESEETEIDSRKCKIRTVYFHLKSARVSISDDLNDIKNFDKYNQREHKGQYFVRAGAEVGIANNTGKYTTGAHLHFGMYICWKRDDGTYQENFNNGYGGAEDPQPYLIDDHIYQLPSDMGNGTYWRNGKVISRSEVDKYMRPELKEQANAYYLAYKAAKLFLSSLMARYLSGKS